MVCIRICGGDGCNSSSDCSFEGMSGEGDNAECDAEKRKSVMEPTFDDTHETVAGDVRPF